MILFVFTLIGRISASNFFFWPPNRPPRDYAYYKTASFGPRHVLHATNLERPHSLHEFGHQPDFVKTIPPHKISGSGEEKVDEDVPARFVFNSAKTESKFQGLKPTLARPRITSKSLTPAIVKSLNKLEDLNILKSFVDYGEEATLERLCIYLDNNSSKAVYYELKGNPKVNTLSLFQKLLPKLVLKAKSLSVFDVTNQPETESSRASRYTIFNTIQAFLHHKVPILRMTEFIKASALFKEVFSRLDQSFIAYFVLTADINEFEALEDAWDVYLPGISQALLMLPKDSQVPIARELFERIKPARRDLNLLKTVFTESDNEDLINLLVEEFFFNPLAHSDLIELAKYDFYHPRWNCVRTELINFGFDFSQLPKPASLSPEPKLPFMMYVADEEELKVYMEAYGQLFMRKYFELALKKNL